MTEDEDGFREDIGECGCLCDDRGGDDIGLSALPRSRIDDVVFDLRSIDPMPTVDA